MWNEPSAKELGKIPTLGENEGGLSEILIHMHFFYNTCDWYVAEYCPVERNFFGYAILNGDLEMSEWGYSSFDELRSYRSKHCFEIDRDLYWKVKPASKIEKIVNKYLNP